MSRKLKTHVQRWTGTGNEESQAVKQVVARMEAYNMSESQRGPSFVHCNICGTEFSVASGGAHVVKRHVEGKKHSELARGMASQSTITASFRKGSPDDQVTTAEVYFATFIAEHNMPFLAADHSTKLCKVMFPDSKIAEGFASGRTKMTAIVKYALAPAINTEVIRATKLHHLLSYVMVVMTRSTCNYGTILE